MFSRLIAQRAEDDRGGTRREQRQGLWAVPGGGQAQSSTSTLEHRIKALKINKASPGSSEALSAIPRGEVHGAYRATRSPVVTATVAAAPIFFTKKTRSLAGCVALALRVI